MSLTAHHYVVLAEQQWKQDNLGGANLAPHRTSPSPLFRRGRARTALRLLAAALHTPRTPPTTAVGTPPARSEP